MASKTYTLELTADELKDLPGSNLTAGGAIYRKLTAIAEQAAQDRAQDDLRLPWRAEKRSDGGVNWGVVSVGPYGCHYLLPERAAKLMSAAPELLEAVQAAAYWQDVEVKLPGPTGRWNKDVKPLIERALRKVETGVPE